MHSKFEQLVDTLTVSPVNVSTSCSNFMRFGLNVFAIEYRWVAGDNLMNKR